MNRQTLTEQDLATMTGPELVALHNDCAASLGCEPVKRFGTKADAIRRTWAKVQAWKEKQQEAAAKQAKAKPRARRGTDLKPTGEPVKPCLIGSKQAVLVDELSRPDGVTMAQLIAALSAGGKPWQEQTVRSGFGWDLKRKGYGVRSTIDPDGAELFRLVVPDGQAIPAHVARGSSKAEG